MDGPCYECTRRHIGCHARCADYIQFKTKLDEINKKRFARSELNAAFNGIVEKRLRQTGRYSHRRGVSHFDN